MSADQPVLNSSAGAVFTVPLYEHATFITDQSEDDEEPTDWMYKILEISEKTNPDYPARILIVEGYIESLYHKISFYNLQMVILQPRTFHFKS